MGEVAKKTNQKVKLSGTLKKFVDAGKTDTRVLGATERFVLSRPMESSRRRDCLHPSSMVKASWCHRAAYFELAEDRRTEPKYKNGLNSYLVFEEGHSIHHKWQNLFKDMGNLYGRWECVDCQSSFDGLPSDHPDHKLKYHEVPLYNEEYNICGSADGILLNFGEPLLLELKSLGEGTFVFEDRQFFIENDNDFKKAWSNMKAPFETHIKQAQMYMKMLELGGYPIVPQEAIFIYESKLNQERKEFVIPKSDWGIAEILDGAKKIMDCVKAKTPPACNIGGNDQCGSCRGL